MFLLDTQTFLWAAMAPSRIKPAVRDLLAKTELTISVSVVSFWEISIKHRLGKLHLENIRPEDMPDVAARSHFEIEPLTSADAATFSLLPIASHKDPFDRMLVWQSILRNWTLISSDAALAQYQSNGLKLLLSV